MTPQSEQPRQPEQHGQPQQPEQPEQPEQPAQRIQPEEYEQPEQPCPQLTQPSVPNQQDEDVDVVMPVEAVEAVQVTFDTPTGATGNSERTGGTDDTREDTRKKRKTLSVEERGLILEEYHRRQKLKLPRDQRTLSTWAYETLPLGAMPSQSTISRILTRHEQNPGGRVIMRKGMQRNRPGMHPELERALYCWIQIEFAKGCAVNWEGVKGAGERMLKRLNERLPEEKRVEMKFSSGWLQRFQERMGIKGRSLGKKGREESGMGTEIGIEKLREIVGGYELPDVFAADEFGHCFNMGPGMLVSGGRGKKKGGGIMRRLVYLGCVNADGSERAPLFVVGETEFRVDRKVVEEWGVWYQSNRRGWLNVEMFHGWLVRFGEWVSKKGGEERKVLLLVDGWNGHGGAGLMPAVRNVEVRFLPNEEGNAIKPFENGIVRGMKVRYRKAQVEQAMDMMDIEEEYGGGEVFDLDAMTGIWTMKSIWDGLPVELVKASWRKTRLLEKKEGEDSVIGMREEPESEKRLIELVGESLKEMWTKGARIDLERFWNPEEEAVGVEEIREEDCVQMAFDEMMDVKEGTEGKGGTGGRKGAGKGASGKRKTDKSEGLPSLGEQLKAVVLVKHLLQREAGKSGNSVAVKRLKEMQVELRKRVADERKQSGLKGFLRPHWSEGGA